MSENKNVLNEQDTSKNQDSNKVSTNTVSEEKDEVKFDFSKIKNIHKSRIWSNKKFMSILVILILVLIPMYFAVKYRTYSVDLEITDNWARDSVTGSLKSQFQNQVVQETPTLPPDAVNREVDRRIKKYVEANSAQIEEAVKQTSQAIRARMQDDDGVTYLSAIDPWFFYRQAENILENGYNGDEMRNGVPWDNHMLAPTGMPAPDHFHPHFAVFVYKLFGPLTGKTFLGIFFLLPVILVAITIIPAFFLGRKIVGNFGGFICAMIIAVNAALMSRTPGGLSDTDAYAVLFPMLITWIFWEAYDAKKTIPRIILSALAGGLTALFAFAWIGWWYILHLLIGTVAGYLIYAYVMKFRKSEESSVSYVSDQLKKALLIIIVYVAFTLIFYFFVNGPAYFFNFITDPFKFTQIKEVTQASVWPNVYTTVAELNVVSINSIIDQVASAGRFSRLFFIFSFLGIILCMVHKKFTKFEYIALGITFIYYLLLLKKVSGNISDIYFIILLCIPPAVFLLWNLYKKTYGENIAFGILLVLWFAASLYATTKGVRFSLILVPSFAVGFGIFVGKVYSHFLGWFHETLRIKKVIIAPILIILLLTLLITPIKTGKAIGQNAITDLDDDWVDALTYIKENSEPNAIIHSWWDYGHWFKAIADRPVTFDGGSQNTPMAHWVGKAFLSPREETAVGIFRMLDCGGNAAYDLINSTVDLAPKSIKIVYDIIEKDKESAKLVLNDYGFDDAKAEEILKYTHCDPPEAFVIASEDMIGKAGVWGHFGLWDFDKSYMYVNVRDTDRSKAVKFLIGYKNYSESEANAKYDEIQTVDANSWIAGWPSYATIYRSCMPTENNTISCSFGNIIEQNSAQQVILKEIIIDPNKVEKSRVMLEYYNRLTSERLGTAELVPAKITMMLGTEYSTYAIQNSTINIGVLVTVSGGNIRAMYSDPALSDSLFTKMFFNEGHALKYFDRIKHNTGVFNQDIFVYKIDWNGESVENYYATDEYLISHILVCGKGDLKCTGNRTQEEALGLAEDLRSRTTETNIKELAYQYSDDPSGKINEGNLGWNRLDAYVSEFSDAVRKLKVGEISQPVKTPFGYHIIYLENKR